MKDRIPLYPGRVTMTPVPGQANTYDMIRADAPQQGGTPLSKATLLSDATAAALGLTGDATPDDALQELSRVHKVGDTLTTARTNLSSKWLLCNGAFIPSKFTKLLELMPTTVQSPWNDLSIPANTVSVCALANNYVYAYQKTTTYDGSSYTYSASVMYTKNGVDWILLSALPQYTAVNNYNVQPMDMAVSNDKIVFVIRKDTVSMYLHVYSLSDGVMGNTPQIFTIAVSKENYSMDYYGRIRYSSNGFFYILYAGKDYVSNWETYTLIRTNNILSNTWSIVQSSYSDNNYLSNENDFVVDGNLIAYCLYRSGYSGGQTWYSTDGGNTFATFPYINSLKGLAFSKELNVYLIQYTETNNGKKYLYDMINKRNITNDTHETFKLLSSIHTYKGKTYCWLNNILYLVTAVSLTSDAASCTVTKQAVATMQDYLPANLVDCAGYAYKKNKVAIQTNQMRQYIQKPTLPTIALDRVYTYMKAEE